MRETTKTLIFVVVAVLLTGAAFVRLPDRTGKDVAFVDQGQPFFPDFKDPTACTDLQVVEYEPSTATASEFQVKFKDGKWVIPSHYDYPADAKDRLAKTSTGVMDLTKDTIRSDLVEDQEKMGVIDPLDAKSTSLKGRGKRVTLRDKSEKVLADFIIGNAIDNASDKTGQRYVRVPGQKRIYGVKMNVDLSTKFADWIETNLLKVDSGKIRKVVFDGRKAQLNVDSVIPIPGEVLTIQRKDSSAPWTFDSLPADKELDTDKLSAMTTALSDLKIVGIRPKPQGLREDLKSEGDGEVKPTTNEAFRSLLSKGFIATNRGLLSSQGQVTVGTDEGVVYTLRYGEVVLASGLDLTAGSEESADAAGKEKKDQKSKDGKKTEGATENRFLFVTVAFDPSLIPPPAPPAPPSGEPKFPDDPFEKLPNDPKRIAEEKEEKEKAEREKAEQERKIDDGKKRVKELTDRFAGWYYVTPGDSYKSIALNRESLVRAKGSKPASSSGMPSMPNFPDPHAPGGINP